MSEYDRLLGDGEGEQADDTDEFGALWEGEPVRAPNPFAHLPVYTTIHQ